MIQAFCFDDKEVPHPASQVQPDREIAEAYEGEVYRCIAGTHMQVTIAPWRDKQGLHWQHSNPSLEDVFIELMGRSKDNFQ